MGQLYLFLFSPLDPAHLSRHNSNFTTSKKLSLIAEMKTYQVLYKFLQGFPLDFLCILDSSK